MPFPYAGAVIDELQKEVQASKTELALCKAELDAYKKKVPMLENEMEKLRVEKESTLAKLMTSEAKKSGYEATVTALERESKMLLEKGQEWRELALNQAGCGDKSGKSRKKQRPQE